MKARAGAAHAVAAEIDAFAVAAIRPGHDGARNNSGSNSSRLEAMVD